MFSAMRVLAGDIGGTKTSVALVDIGPHRVALKKHARYASAGYASLEDILGDFLAGERRLPEAAAFGVAGPVRGGEARVTKLPWVISQRRLARRVGIPRVLLVNDFLAAALGLSYVAPRRLAVLLRGEPEPGGPIALIGAGTGLGQAVLLSIDGRYEPFASEGGHADFGPRNAREDRLARFVRKRHGRVSRDRLLSGEGLRLIYDFLTRDGGVRQSPAVARAFASEDRSEVISRFGLQGRDRLCAEALGLFVSIYGSEAGNLALQYRATGGVYLAGGIAPKILPALRRESFRASFRDKPPLAAMLSTIPVRVVLEPELGLFGAAAAAYRMAMVIDVTRPPSKIRIR
ncbi:MAG: glucokinase [Thermoanaerobaculia bacterium]